MAIKLKLSKQQIQYIAGGVIGVGALGFVYIKFFWMPLSKHIEDMRAKIEENAAKIERGRAEELRLPRLERELADLYQQASEMEMQLPRNKSVPDVLVKLTSLAEKHNVTVLAFTPGGQRPKEFFIEWSFPVSMQGAYHNIGKFLAALALEQRIYNVQNVSYGAPTDLGKLPVSFTLIVYQYKG